MKLAPFEITLKEVTYTIQPEWDERFKAHKFIVLNQGDPIGAVQMNFYEGWDWIDEGNPADPDLADEIGLLIKRHEGFEF